MTKGDLIKEIIGTYERHAWEFQGALLRLDTKAELAKGHESVLDDVRIEDSSFDALWFSRPSHGGAEAWELRLVAETPYALFERIGRDEPANKRAKMLGAMEQRMAQYVDKG